MGMCSSRNKPSYTCEKDPRILVQKMRFLQQEISVILKQREEDREVYEQEMTAFALKEAKWRRERKKLQGEVKQLRKRLEEREEKIRKMEEQVKIAQKSEKLEGVSAESGARTGLLLVEQMREERARRDETVEKWKMLYLAIKNELDDLIQRTTHQGTPYWRAEEEDLEELQQELKVKDETIEYLKAEIATMEEEEYKRKREMDILRQSLKIMSSKKVITSSTSIVKSTLKPMCFTKSLTKLALVN